MGTEDDDATDFIDIEEVTAGELTFFVPESKSVWSRLTGRETKRKWRIILDLPISSDDVELEKVRSLCLKGGTIPVHASSSISGGTTGEAAQWEGEGYGFWSPLSGNLYLPTDPDAKPTSRSKTKTVQTDLTDDIRRRAITYACDYIKSHREQSSSASETDKSISDEDDTSDSDPTGSSPEDAQSLSAALSRWQRKIKEYREHVGQLCEGND